MQTADGKTIVYLRRRFVPPAGSLRRCSRNTPSSRATGSTMSPRNTSAIPEQFWRVCDANSAMQPDELTDTVGRTLRITLPEGVPGLPNA